MDLVQIGQAIHQWPLANFLRRNPLAYPAVESVHLIALALLFGSIVMVDLRILGISRSISVQQLARHALPWTVSAFVFAAISGVLLFIAHADELVSSSTFFLKLGLIGLAGINAALMHGGPYAQVAQWDVGTLAPIQARAMAAVSIVIWIGVIVCGRWLAYA